MVDAICTMLIGQDIENLSLQKLPFVFSRAYDGFECAIWDAYARLKGMRVVDLLGGPVNDKVKITKSDSLYRGKIGTVTIPWIGETSKTDIVLDKDQTRVGIQQR